MKQCKQWQRAKSSPATRIQSFRQLCRDRSSSNIKWDLMRHLRHIYLVLSGCVLEQLFPILGALSQAKLVPKSMPVGRNVQAKNKMAEWLDQHWFMSPEKKKGRSIAGFEVCWQGCWHATLPLTNAENICKILQNNSETFTLSNSWVFFALHWPKELSLNAMSKHV